MRKFRIAGLTPAAHGTLIALRRLGEIRFYTEDVAIELEQQQLAKRSTDRLRVTDRGKAISNDSSRTSSPVAAGR